MKQHMQIQNDPTNDHLLYMDKSFLPNIGVINFLASFCLIAGGIASPIVDYSGLIGRYGVANSYYGRSVGNMFSELPVNRPSAPAGHSDNEPPDLPYPLAATMVASGHTEVLDGPRISGENYTQFTPMPLQGYLHRWMGEGSGNKMRQHLSCEAVLRKRPHE